MSVLEFGIALMPSSGGLNFRWHLTPCRKPTQSNLHYYLMLTLYIITMALFFRCCKFALHTAAPNVMVYVFYYLCPPQILESICDPGTQVRCQLSGLWTFSGGQKLRLPIPPQNDFEQGTIL